MQEYTMNGKYRTQMIVMGTLLYGLMMYFLMRSVREGGWSSSSTIINVLFVLYAAYVLARPFVSYLRVTETAVEVRDGLRARLVAPFVDIAFVMTDATGRRVMIQMEQGKRFIFEFVYTDLKGFLNTLRQRGVRVETAIQ